MKKIPMLERFAAQSLVEYEGELIFSKEKFAELIVQECILTIQMGITRDGHNTEKYIRSMKHIKQIKEHFGVED